MSLTLDVDAAAWRAHLKKFVSAHAGIVPVVKGNGYGFGARTLAAEAASLGVPTLAIGTYDELPSAADFPGDVLVLSPWRPGASTDQRLIHTVSRLADLRALASDGGRPNVVVEVLTSMRRHGIAPEEAASAAREFDRVDFRGWALHLPLTGNQSVEGRRLARTVMAVTSGPLWVSHLEPADAAALTAELATPVHLRVGTALWLGARAALSARATVLDVHQVNRGDSFGYRQRRASRGGHIVVVAGGTANGIGLEAPTPASTPRQRAIALASGGLEATGRARSPFTIAGKKRWFAEPPHMQCSMVWLPGDVTPPEVGHTVDVDVRYTTTTFDALSLSPSP